ncbi:DNA-binding protein [Aulographum hederae CBS 113979]|uniref:DNA-binding protein n=1 Tax=Aulographum hederae CBS 113979 TaxID=1176131 RepID=A0A6G1H822_9PEZI|nr:DNA-binding protein [Aulographum hederae CBS 113979]
MASPDPPNPPTLSHLLSSFSSFLTVSIHSILYLRDLYPSTTFLTAKAYNYPVHQSRHPKVCEWVTDAVAAVEEQLLKGLTTAVEIGKERDTGRNTRVERVVLVIFGPVPVESASQTDYGMSFGDSFADSEPEYQIKPLERYIFDTSRFPIIPSRQQHTPFNDPAESTDQPSERQVIDLEEQFRAILSSLDQRTSRLSPLPKDSTFTIAIELADEASAPLKHPQAWIPVEPGMQRRKLTEDADIDTQILGITDGKEGEDIRGDERKVTPIRAVEAGEMVFEMWIEESKAKKLLKENEG